MWKGLVWLSLGPGCCHTTWSELRVVVPFSLNVNLPMCSRALVVCE
jgi:hypothetical protein